MPPQPPTEITTAELWRRMDEFQKTMKEGFDRLDRRVETLGYVSLDRYEAEQRAIHRQISDLQGTARWVARSVGALIFTVVGAMVVMYVTTRGGV